MQIAQISDTHITTIDDEDPKFPERINALKAFVRHINALDEKPNLIMHTGDITHGGLPEYYATIKNEIKELSVPIYFARGNRDISENMLAGLGDLWTGKLVDGFLIYSIDKYPVRLIAMDTHNRESNIGTTCSVRLGILEELLKQQPDTPTALFMHHPPFVVPTSKYPFQFDDQVLADAFLELVTQHKQIVHLFCGHMHRHYTVNLQTCNASCVPSLPVDNRLGEFEAGMDNKPLYQLHKWNGSTFDTTLVAVD